MMVSWHRLRTGSVLDPILLAKSRFRRRRRGRVVSERDSLTGVIERLRSWPIAACPSRGGPTRISLTGSGTPRQG
jgi:hypothetical protein